MVKKRPLRHTIVIGCEGKTDHLFVSHLKKLYPSRGTKHITLKEGSGGDIFTFISEITKNARIRDYDEKWIVWDSNGKSQRELKKAEREVQGNDIQLIWQRPCLEGVLLRILKGTRFENESSARCKSLFKREYWPNNTTWPDTLLEKLFPKNILEPKRREVSELDQLLKLIEHNC